MKHFFFQQIFLKVTSVCIHSMSVNRGQHGVDSAGIHMIDFNFPYQIFFSCFQTVYWLFVICWNVSLMPWYSWQVKVKFHLSFVRLWRHLSMVRLHILKDFLRFGSITVLRYSATGYSLSRGQLASFLSGFSACVCEQSPRTSRFSGHLSL